MSWTPMGDGVATAGCFAPCGMEQCMSGCVMKARLEDAYVGRAGHGMGCICPPTSERTCRNQLCPRQPPKPVSEMDGAWVRTTALRFVERMAGGRGYWHEVRTLQQQWVDNASNVEWRDVPVVEEGA